MAWYGERGRDLRIRTTREPWHVLVSEVMSQQTQISRVDEAWVGDERATPQPGRFYGGWVTSRIVGPIKGEPGSHGW